MPAAARVHPEHWEEVAQLWLTAYDALEAVAAWQLGPDAYLAPDIVQESFHDAALQWTSLRQRSQGAQEAWLRTVVRNKIYDHWRTDRRRRSAAPREADQPDRAASPRDTAMQALDAVDVEACIKTIKAMPEARRRVAFLRWRGAWSTQEIAEHLGIAESTVRVHLHHARLEISRQLGRALNGEQDEEGGRRP